MNPPVLHSPKRVRVETAGQWRMLAPPGRWGRGKPLTELAERWTASALPEIDALLASQPGTAGFVPTEGWVALPGLDLLVAGQAPGGVTLLAALPMADEPIGPTVGEAYEAARPDLPRNAPPPSERHAQLVFRAPAHVVRALPQSLLSASAVLIEEARSRGATQAVLVIHEFRSSLTPRQLVADQVTAVDEYVRRLSHQAFGVAEPGQLVGPMAESSGIALHVGRALVQR